MDLDWSLHAIVRGSSGDFSKLAADVDMAVYQTEPLSDVVLQSDPTQYQLCEFDDGEFRASFPDELLDFYKPFYPAPANSVPSQSVIEFQDQIVSHDKQAGDKSDQPSHAAGVPAPKYKRRKSQQKREVIQVSAEGLSSDMWAWRKYGQKPIKGSPYPRSYYRCSSSKGCLARKQVEQSCTDSEMYIITYTGEHSHSKPTRRNSLAGTVRQKFPSSKTRSSLKQEKPWEPNSPASPKTINDFNYSSSDATIKEDNREEVKEGDLNLTYNGDDFMIMDFVLNQDFFSGLDEFDEFVSEFQSPTVCHPSTQQFSLKSYS